MLSGMGLITDDSRFPGAPASLARARQRQKFGYGAAARGPKCTQGQNPPSCFVPSVPSNATPSLRHQQPHGLLPDWRPTCKLTAWMITLTLQGRQLPSLRSTTIIISPKVSQPRGWKSAQANRAGGSWSVLGDPVGAGDGRGALAPAVEKFEIRAWKAEGQKKTPSSAGGAQTS